MELVVTGVFGEGHGGLINVDAMAAAGKSVAVGVII